MTVALDAALDIGSGFTGRHDLDVTTQRSDRTRAELVVSGHLDRDSSTVLRAVVDGHLRAGRRYLRVDVRGVITFSEHALRVLSELHRTVLDARGTLVLTGVTAQHERLLRTADAGLFLLAPTAAERPRARTARRGVLLGT